MSTERAPSRLDRRMLLACGLALPALTACPGARGDALGPPPPASGWKATTVASVKSPWGLAWTRAGEVLITTKPGRLFTIEDGRLVELAFDGLPELFAEGQGGLLDIAVHPSDDDKPRLYFTLATGNEEANRVVLVRGRLEGRRVTGVETIFSVTPDKEGDQHFGSRLVFLPDGTLLMSIGDGGNPPARVGGLLARDQAQNVRSHHGSILRLNADGRAAEGNPFVGREGALPELWTIGHRNIQGLALDDRGRVWANEHGPRGGDEINRIERGKNYGWPRQSFGRDYRTFFSIGETSLPGTEPPLLAWTPATAPSGLAAYNGDKFPHWRGSLFSGGLVSQDVRRVELDVKGQLVRQERLHIGQRVRDVRQGPDGYLYVLTDREEGRLLRIEPG